MAASVSRPAEQTGRRGRLWWLPSGGYGNGLDDDAWVPVLEVSEQVVPTVLGVLGERRTPVRGESAARTHRRTSCGWVPAPTAGPSCPGQSDALPGAGGGAARRQRMAVTADRRIAGSGGGIRGAGGRRIG